MGEEVQDGRVAPQRDGALEPGEIREVLRVEPEAARRGRSKLESKPSDVDRPRFERLGRPLPAFPGVVAKGRPLPGFWVEGLTGRGRRFPVHDPVAEPLEAAALARVEQLVVHTAMMPGSVTCRRP